MSLCEGGTRLNVKQDKFLAKSTQSNQYMQFHLKGHDISSSIKVFRLTICHCSALWRRQTWLAKVKQDRILAKSTQSNQYMQCSPNFLISHSRSILTYDFTFWMSTLWCKHTSQFSVMKDNRKDFECHYKTYFHKANSRFLLFSHWKICRKIAQIHAIKVSESRMSKEFWDKSAYLLRK